MEIERECDMVEWAGGSPHVSVVTTFKYDKRYGQTSRTLSNAVVRLFVILHRRCEGMARCHGTFDAFECHISW